MASRFLDVPGGRLACEVTGPDDASLVVWSPGMGDRAVGGTTRA